MNSNELFMDGRKLPKTLSKQEVYELLQKVKQGDVVARNKLIEHNIRLVLYEVTHRFKSVEYDKNDLVSIGNIGLIKAITTFDTSKKVEFSTYATRCIDNEILMFLRKLKKDQNVDSLDRTINYDKDGNELKIEDIISDGTDITESYTDNETYQIIRQVVKDLPELDRKIIMLYFGFYNNKTYTQKEIADMLSISRSWISRLITKIVKKLGQQLQRKGVIELSIEEQTTKKETKKLITENMGEISPTTIKEHIVELQTEKNNISELELLEQKDQLQSDIFVASTIFAVSKSENVIKEDCEKVFELLRNENFNQLVSVFSIKELLIIYLKLGYVDGKYFSTDSIAKFLDIKEQEVIDITRKVLLLYKENINNIIDTAIELLTEEQVKVKKI